MGTTCGTPLAGYEKQCVGLLLEKLGAVTFDYDIEKDVLLLAKAREGMQERRLEDFCRTLCTEKRGMIHPDSVERLVALLRGQRGRSFWTWPRSPRGAMRGMRLP